MKKVIDFLIKGIYILKDTLELTNAWRVAMLIIDITLVVFIAYYVFRLIKKTRAEQIVKGVLILFVLMVFSKILNLVILDFILTNIMTYGVLLFIVIFQPELRNAFEKLGRNKLVEIFDFDDKMKNKQIVAEIVKAVEIMSLKRIGSIIVIEQSTKISDIIREGVDLSSKVSSELLQTIFIPRTPLHDGAVVIGENKIKAASCVLPLASENVVPKNLGTRHRAAVGMSEVSDALVIVISEETGTISFVENGKMKRGLTGEKLSEILLKGMDKNKDRIVVTKMKENMRKED
ncbi:MAG: diadenylate cyclase CdaA [Clostridia bacterium]|nr:diadenylate cyclase CdaA [Clostridia bacterium]